MRKTDPALNADTPRPRRPLAPRALALALALLLAPVVYEGGQVILDRWMSMSGAHREYRTPVLDAIAEMSRKSTAELHQYSGRLFGQGSWNASTAVPLGIAWALLISFVFLRRTH